MLGLGNKLKIFIFFLHIKSHVCFGLPHMFGGNTFISNNYEMHKIHIMGKANLLYEVGPRLHMLNSCAIVYQGWMIKQCISINFKFG
jgi:hypothetical protein